MADCVPTSNEGWKEIEKIRIVFDLAALSIKPILVGFGLNWLCWSARKSKTTPYSDFSNFPGKKNHSSEVKIAPKIVHTYFLIYSRCEWFDCRWESALSEVGRSLPPSSSSIFEVRPTRPEAWRQVALLGGQYVLQSFFQQAFEAASKL